MKKLIVVLLACVLLAAMLFVTGCDETSGGEGVPQTYTVTFVADGEIVDTISFTEGDTSVSMPVVPHKDCCVGTWERYTLGSENITVSAVYSEPHAYLNKIEAKVAKCNEKGNIEYYTCGDCGKYFSDAEGAAEITDKESVVLAELDCSYVDGSCERCGAPEPSEGLEYQLSDDESYYTVIGIGTCEDTEVVIPKKYNGKPVKSIGSSAFSGCSRLTSITIPDSVTSIGSYAFSDCTGLTEIKFNAVAMNDLSWNNYVFYNAGKNGDGINVTIGKGVTKIPAYLFRPDMSYYSPKITSVEFEEGSVCENIGNYAFCWCSNLTSITIPDGVTSIGEYAFWDCISLTSVTMGNGVTSIGRGAFSGCSSLTSVTIPDSVTSIGSYAFSNTGYYNDEANWENGVLYIGNYLIETSISGSYTIKNGTLCIAGRAFYACSNLTSITIPDSVTSIGGSAFYGCSSLTSVTIPNSVTSIGDDAFSGCYKLVEVYNLSSLNITNGSKDNGYVGYYALGIYTDADAESKQWTDENGYMFYEDGDSCYLTQYTGTDTDLTLPANCNGKNYGINKYAFYYCSRLTSVTIPGSVTSIGDHAFSGCVSLTTINYTGSEEEWNAITNDIMWYSLIGEYTVNYNYTGK